MQLILAHARVSAKSLGFELEWKLPNNNKKKGGGGGRIPKSGHNSQTTSYSTPPKLPS